MTQLHDCETVHAAFSIPIDNSLPSVNWSLARYAVIFLDEVSMIPQKIFDHILSTLHQLSTRPVLVISGDPHQQQPISNGAQGICQAESVFADVRFRQISVSHHLTDQFRCSDPEYYDILNHLRHWPPTSAILRTLHSSNRLLCNSDTVTDDLLLHTVRENPSATFITVTRAATSRVTRFH